MHNGKPEVIYQRLGQQGKATTGIWLLTVPLPTRAPGPFAWGLENPLRWPKVKGESRTPPGVFQMFKRKHSKRVHRYKRLFGHDFVVELLDVPHFTHIQAHIGCFPHDTDGCYLIAADALNSWMGDRAAQINHSVRAYKMVYRDIWVPLFKEHPKPHLWVRDEKQLLSLPMVA